MNDAQRRSLERLAVMGDRDAMARLAADTARFQAAEIREPGRVMLSNEHPDLVVLADLDEEGLSYEFHTMRLWRHAPSGRVFWDEDSGCSCPSPWEDDWFQFDGITLDTSLSELTAASLAAFEREVEGFPADQGDRSDFANVARQAMRDPPPAPTGSETP